MRLSLPRIYPLTDVHISGLSHVEQVIRLSEGGATLIQLREKNSAASDFFIEAQKAVVAARQRGVRVVINDRVDVALALGADGVHLGQEDFPPEAARDLLGPEAVIGVSTHSVEQAIQAARFRIDYLAIGPIFATTSKTITEPIVGLEKLREVRRAVGNLPIVGIGGITHDNARGVIEAGADSVAVISALLAKPNQISAQTQTLISLL
jgi:thiamine-phosphate pyrophosphorylase